MEQPMELQQVSRRATAELLHSSNNNKLSLKANCSLQDSLANSYSRVSSNSSPPITDLRETMVVVLAMYNSSRDPSMDSNFRVRRDKHHR
jgi:hypothetical protein